jgi:hypothetical protein
MKLPQTPQAKATVLILAMLLFAIVAGTLATVYQTYNNPLVDSFSDAADEAGRIADEARKR